MSRAIQSQENSYDDIRKDHTTKLYAEHESVALSLETKPFTNASNEIDKYEDISGKSCPRRRPSLRKARSSLMNIFDGIREKRRYTEEEKAFLRNVHVHAIFSVSGSISDSISEPNTSRRKACFLIDPSGNTNYYWLMMLTVMYVFSANILVLRAAFTELRKYGWTFWLAGDCAWDLINIADVIFSMHVTYMDDGILETNTRKIRSRYMHSFTFAIDIIALIPIDFLYLKSKWKPALRLNRLLKGHRVTSFFEKADTSSTYPNALRLLSLLSLMFTVIHWNACLYFILSRSIGFGEDDWVYPGIQGMRTLNTTYASLTRQYIQSFYWSTFTLTTIGELTRPNNNVEYIFVITDFLIGILLFATVVGYIGNVVQNTQTDRVQFQHRLDSVKMFMQHHQIPRSLCKRVIQWFDYFWENKKLNSEEDILKSLPNKLKAEITSHVYLDSLKKVSLFKDCERGFLYELVLRLRSQLYLPDDYIYCKGELGYEMYIVHQGKVQFIDSDGTTVVEELGSGYHFGEIPLLDMNPYGNRRTDSVRSVGFTELFVISKRDLVEILSEYPSMRSKFVMFAQDKLRHFGICQGFAPQQGSPTSTPRGGLSSIREGHCASLLSAIPRYTHSDLRSGYQHLGLVEEGNIDDGVPSPQNAGQSRKASVCGKCVSRRLDEIENRVFIDIQLERMQQLDKMRQLETALKLLVEERNEDSCSISKENKDGY